MTKESGFKITEGKGFHITFKNDWTILTQFGMGSYTSENGRKRLRVPLSADDFSPESQARMGAKGSCDAEIMIFPPDGIEYDGENPIGYQSPENFADIIAMIRSKP